MPKRTAMVFFSGLAACSSAASSEAPPKPDPMLDPVGFFTGATSGAGRLKVVLADARAIRIESRGTADGKGGIMIDQTVIERGKPDRVRRWNLRPLPGNRVTGTLSDAASAVSGELAGNRLHLAYRMKGGLVAQQYLYLQPNGTLLNRMTMRKLGIVVARFDETIVKSLTE